MKKHLILIYMFALTNMICYGNESDSLIIRKYRDDTVGFGRVDTSGNALFAVYWRYIGQEGLSKSKFNRIVRKYARKEIKTIEDACVWLRLNIYKFNENAAFTIFLSAPEYKVVKDGFLIMGELKSMNDAILANPKRYIDTYFVGFDHSVVQVRADEFKPPQPCFINITIDTLSISYKFVQEITDSAQIVYPEFPGGVQHFANYVEDNMLQTSFHRHHFFRDEVNTAPVRLLINEKGRISNKDMLIGSDSELLFEVFYSMVACCYRWIPGKINGENVPCEMNMTIKTEIKENRASTIHRRTYNWREFLDLMNNPIPQRVNEDKSYEEDNTISFNSHHAQLSGTKNR